uniref:8-oxo-dGTP pyrophosphatase MutT, NUDIX family n=1 Tax=Candidatus Kentrum sp. MB TaxID=2138164 RepID=A0A451B900_9GAMM|nr:MAG: 8-oxo-dGTP pyrophosphatase MutT, NUDIX family [Candidatus Kentron sp. MB]VFK29348.1 MAG: 8-oxo-dGTP pyrophosphatase MutT, NUDIX family [Candidatus Kentron sp. MB]VFK74758.1 MAG: 8-oxo-dGTP pyrophosphatase MutT, NUDIX family [Candidatus Kentron sp. MB]
MPDNTTHHDPRSLRERIIQCVRRHDDVPTKADIQPRPTIGDFDLTSPPKPIPDRPLTPAAVLVPIVEHPHDLSILLTKRTSHLYHHPGQISFPGGRAEETDNGPVATALRETREEIGLDPALVRVIGFLDTYETTTAYLVTPVVGLVTPGFRLQPDPFEVERVFEMPVSFLMDPGNHEIQSRTIKGTQHGFYVIEYQGDSIWGATAGMLINLYRRIMGVSID